MVRVASGKYLVLLCGLALLGFSHPILTVGGPGIVAWHVAFWVVLLGSVHAVNRRRRVRGALLVLALAAMASGILGLLGIGGDASLQDAVERGSGLLALALATGVLLVDVLAGHTVDTDRILGAICVYVLLALTFSQLFLTLAVLGLEPLTSADPALQTTLQTAGPARLALFLYFSFTTLTTLGFGDITPGSTFARFLAGAEAMIGQLYLAILVARLVGLHLMQHPRRKADGPD